MVLQDLLDLGHFVTRLKLAPEAGVGDPMAEGDRERAVPLAAAAGDAGAGPRLADAAERASRRCRRRPSPTQAAEMVLVRLAYVADLPAPAELVRDRLRQRSRRARGSRAAAVGRRRRCRARGGSSPRRRRRLALPAPAPTAAASSPAVVARGPRRRAVADAAPPAPSRSTRCRRISPRWSRCSSSTREALIRAQLCVAACISSRSSPAGSSSARPTGRRAISPTGSSQLLGEWTGIALGRRGVAGRGRADLARAGGAARDRELRSEVARASAGPGGARRLSRARRSPRCASASSPAEPGAEPELDPGEPDDDGDQCEEDRGHEESRPADEAGAGRCRPRWPRCRPSSKRSR